MPITRQGYKSNIEFIGKAFNLYMNGVNTATALAKELQKEYPGIVRQTIAKIIKEFKWEESRNRYLEMRSKGVNERSEIIAVLRDMKDKLKDIIQGGTHNHQHFAQLRQVCADIALYEGFDPRFGGDGIVLSTDFEMQAFVDAILEDEVVGKVYRSRKAEVKNRFEQKLKQKGIEAKV